MLGFDHTALLNLTVNLVPIAILLFFVVYLPFNFPFGSDGFALFVTEALHIIPLVLLAVVTYLAGRVIDVEGE